MAGGAARGGDVDERAVLDRHGRRVHSPRAVALRFVHQRVRSLNQIGRELSCHATAFRDRSQPQAHDADVDADGIGSQAVVLASPVVRRYGLPEPLSDLGRLDTAGKLRDEETEFVPAETRVQVAAPRRRARRRGSRRSESDPRGCARRAR